MIKRIKFLFFYIFINPFLKIRVFKSGLDNTWVIGGHAGRDYADNSAALHDYIVNETKQQIIWITNNNGVYKKLLDEGVGVILKDTIKARIAIVLSVVLIRSHGHGDLDSFIGKKTPVNGMIIHLNHCLNYLKAGQMYAPHINELTAYQKKKVEKKVFKFNFLLAVSPLEQQYFRLSIPFKADQIVLGGGAHLDNLVNAVDEKIILYFPTWRDKKLRARVSLNEVIYELTSNQKLSEWLSVSGCRLVICSHINTKTKNVVPGSSELIQSITHDQLETYLLKCSVLISDYSGLIHDALYLNKPVIFFPYDLDDYLKVRSLYCDYKDALFGPQVNTSDELIFTLVNTDWKDLSQYESKRKELYQKMFPDGKGGYAMRSYKAITKLLNLK